MFLFKYSNKKIYILCGILYFCSTFISFSSAQISFGPATPRPTHQNGATSNEQLTSERFGNVNFGHNSKPLPTSPSSGKPLTNQQCQTLNGQPGVCQERIKCGIFYADYLKQRSLRDGRCNLGKGKFGFCCPVVHKNREISVEQLQPKRLNKIDLETRLGISLESRIGNSARKIGQRTEEHIAIESRLLTKPFSAVKRGSSSHGHLLFFQTSKRAIELSNFGYSLVQSSREISTRLGKGVSKKESGEGLKDFNVKNTVVQGKCPALPTCDPRQFNYRTIDGSCNNLRVPGLGSSFTTLYRIILPDYTDGIWTPRVSKDALPLPSARLLSSSIHPDNNVPDSRFSLYVMQFGQFLDHDLSHVPIFRYRNGSGIECCTRDGNFLPAEETHPFCLPIEIPANDPFYSNHRQRCMNFVRSMVGPRLDCSLGYADQLSQITHWLDNSNVYGSMKEEEHELRLFRDGKLRAGRLSVGHGGHGPRKEMLPLQDREGDECTNPDSGTHCFNAGDLRVNEMIGLTATHLLFFREHNRIASNLKLLNPGWNDQQLYLEARKILNAEYQHIIYNEWLPIIVGRQFMEVYGILPLTTGYATDYNDKIDPSVSNAFAAAAFRMGHTLIQGILQLVNEVGVVDEQLRISQHFNNPFRIREEGILDKILRALTNEPIQSFDPFVTTEVTNRLFQPRNQSFGMDLVALNIQRARDHGVPGYNFFLEACRLGRANTFSDFSSRIPNQIVQTLSQLYNNVDDVDLFVGGISERPFPGALLGPTFTCIVGDQFARAKKADRFAYDLGGFSHSFTLGQLDQIRRSSFSRILCDNGDRITKMQPLAFFLPNGEFNPYLDCSSEQHIPRVDLSFWRR